MSRMIVKATVREMQTIPHVEMTSQSLHCTGWPNGNYYYYPDNNYILILLILQIFI